MRRAPGGAGVPLSLVDRTVAWRFPAPAVLRLGPHARTFRREAAHIVHPTHSGAWDARLHAPTPRHRPGHRALLHPSSPGAAQAKQGRLQIAQEAAVAPHPILPGLAWFAGSRHPAVRDRWCGLIGAQRTADRWYDLACPQKTMDRWYDLACVAPTTAARSDSQVGVAPAAAADHLGSWGRGDRQGHR
jgi:hypothetical protein